MIEDEFAGMRREIAQARGLIDDAVEKLTHGFENLGELLERADPGGALGAQAREEVTAMVTALQFQDLVDQLLKHTLRRVEVVEQAFAKGMDVCTAADGGLPRKPVAQRHLDAGDAELF